MKKLIFVMLMPGFVYAADLKQISPANARNLLRTGNLPSFSDASTMKQALQLGLQLQALGNESFVYDLRALVYIAGGASGSASSLQKELYTLSLDVIATSKNASETGAYQDLFQTAGSLRLAAHLALNGHEDAAIDLTVFMRKSFDDANSSNKWGDFGNILAQIRMSFTDNGDPRDAGSLQKALDLISKLNE